MKKFYLKKLAVVLAIIFCSQFSFGQGAPFCPSILASSTNSPLCAGSCATLSAAVVPLNQTSTYSVQSIPYVPFAYTGGTPVSVGTDDVWSPIVNLPFPFCYFGNTFNNCILGSNGQISFNTGLALGYDNWVISTALPNLLDMPGNTICGPFRDIDPSFGGTMKYYFTGTAPCRSLVIYWSNIPLYSNPGACSGKPNSTFQIVLYETTNYIDVYIQNSTACTGWNSGYGIIGIQNANATVGYAPPLRNFPTAWTATNEGWRFVPTGVQSYTVNWAGPGGFIGTGLTQTVCPAATTDYTATMNITSCSGVTSTYTSAVTVTVSPNPPPIVTANVTQFSCANPTVNFGNATISSGTPGYTLNWSPAATPTGSTATTYSVSGLTVGVNTISVIDAMGCSGVTTVNVNPAPAVPSFTLSAPMGTVVGCAPPSISLTAVNTSTLANMTYTWTSTTTGTATGTTINGTAPGGSNTYTVIGSDFTVGSCLATQTIAIIQNTTAPIVNVNPITGNLSCNGAPANFTATCLPFSLNIWGTWYDPSGNPIGALSNSPILLSATFPGTYVATFTNITNGCVGSNSVSVTASNIIPTMTVNALNGYTITCAQPCLVMNITSSATLAPKGYTWTNMATSASVTPANGGYTICVPGNYLAQFHDGNFCTVSQMITVSIDTVRPSPSCLTGLASNGFTLNCYNSCITPTAISNPLLPVSSYSWITPPNLTVASNTVPICLANISSSTTPTNFTVLAQGANGCVGRAKIPFYKDIYVPPYTAVFTPSALTCQTLSVALSPQSTSTVPTTFTFTSPPPTTTATTAGALFSIPGPYTMHYQNQLNGCTGDTYTTIPINISTPATVALSPTVIACGSNTVGLIAGLTSSANCTFIWKGPFGSGITAPNSYSTAVDMIGLYQVIITNTITGCKATNTVMVSPGTLTISFVPDPQNGFAPLNVNFTNTSQLGAIGTGTVYTWWGYGNGATNSYTNASTLGSPNGSASYPSAGSYTVLLVVTQSVTVAGNTTGCSGTYTAVVNVDMPSQLSIPNVFTPNGDGVNDIFMLQTTNLTEITCVIFDRWGVKMYDVNSDKGNIAWDGKTLFGKDAPAGTYFYIIKATGKDTQSFEQKGSLSLFR